MRVGLLSDVHANLVALEAVLSSLGPVDALWVTGDTVGYGPDPSDVLALLRSRGAVLVQGNHDRAVATGEGLDFFHDRAADAARLHSAWLTSEERDVLASLPQVTTIERFTLCHGSLRDPLWEYVTSASAAAATLSLATTEFTCCGHTHLPSLFVHDDGRTRALAPRLDHGYPLDARTLVNAGSVGQPRDGDPRAAFAVIDTNASTITFGRARYDIATTQRRIRERGLPDMFAERLAFGV